MTQLSRWIEARQLTSERLTDIYLERLERFDPKLRCVITLTREQALAQAKQADREIAAGHYRGPLHGIPWGAKDLLDTAGIPTTYGAEPFGIAFPTATPSVVQRLNAGRRGAGGQAEPGRAGAERHLVRRPDHESVAARGRLFGFERRPGRGDRRGAGRLLDRQRDRRQHRQPLHALRRHRLAAHYGRVPRTGAMTLCWSLDKLGPMTRGVEDAMLVLQAISGPGSGRSSRACPASSISMPTRACAGLRVGYFPQWMKEARRPTWTARRSKRCRKLGMTPVEVSIPDWPYDSLQHDSLRRSRGGVRRTDAERPGRSN